jgi:sarcosine oxidase subunit gamma
VVGGAAGSRHRVLCHGPADWLVVAESPSAALLAEFQRLVQGSTLQVSDQSQGLAALQVSGSRARELLTKGCCLDLHPRVFPPGACARTRLAHVPVIVDAAADADMLTCYVGRSYLDYLRNWLDDAAVEFQDTNP